MEALKVQTQIRQNAEEVSTFLSDLNKWENRAKAKDTVIINKKKNSSGGLKYAEMNDHLTAGG
jgi:hypothetical protein